MVVRCPWGRVDHVHCWQLPCAPLIPHHCRSQTCRTPGGQHLERWVEPLTSETLTWDLRIFLLQRPDDLPLSVGLGWRGQLYHLDSQVFYQSSPIVNSVIVIANQNLTMPQSFPF